MPYIELSRRVALANGGNPATAGEMNYAITKIILQYWTTSGIKNYDVINDIVGALEGAKAEFQRRIVAPYEDKKIQENGDVYPVA